MSKRRCSVEGCEKPHNACGYCAAHYQRWRRWGDPLGSAPEPIRECAFPGCGRSHDAHGLCSGHLRQQRQGTELRPLRPLRRNAICGYEGCGRPHEAKGWCVRHLRIVRKFGRPEGALKPADFPGERWLPAPGYEGLYEVSTFGRVWSIPRFRALGRMLKWIPDKDGYPFVALSRNGREQRFPVHRLVLLAFAGPLPAALVTRHLDGNVLNARIENLAYGTYSENEQDKLRHGRHHLASRTHCRPGNHEYTPENTILQMSSAGRVHRRCRECERQRAARRRYAAIISVTSSSIATS